MATTVKILIIITNLRPTCGPK